MIYLDSAATSFFRPPEVLEAVAEAMISFGNALPGRLRPFASGFAHGISGKGSVEPAF